MKPPRPPPERVTPADAVPGEPAPDPSAEGIHSLLRGLEANSERIQDVLGRLQELQRLLWTEDEGTENEGTIAAPVSPATGRGARVETDSVAAEPARPRADPQGGTIPRRRRKEEKP
jgi:hypothetical protein